MDVLFDVEACPKDKSQTTLDFTKLSAEECQSDFYLSISEYCKLSCPLLPPLFEDSRVLMKIKTGAQDSSWGGGYDPDYTIEGGLLLNDCGLFSLSGLPAAST